MGLTSIQSLLSARSVNGRHEGGLRLANAQELATKLGHPPSRSNIKEWDPVLWFWEQEPSRGCRNTGRIPRSSLCSALSPEVRDRSITCRSALRNHFPGYSGITDMKTALLYCSRKFCRLRYVEQTNPYPEYLPQINDLLWVLACIPFYEVPG